jgi:hypothetical protein
MLGHKLVIVLISVYANSKAIQNWLQLNSPKENPIPCKKKKKRKKIKK